MKYTIQTFLMVLMLFGSLAAAQPSFAQVKGDKDVPDGYTLSSAYPNPFNPTTRFSLTVTRTQNVRVAIYNMLGQPIKTLYAGVMEANEPRSFTFNADNLPSGIYLYRVQGETFSAVRQVTLMK